MKIVKRIPIEPGSAISWYWGFVRHDHQRFSTWVAIVPLNRLIRWAWNLYARQLYPVGEWTLIEERDEARAEAAREHERIVNLALDHTQEIKQLKYTAAVNELEAKYTRKSRDQWAARCAELERRPSAFPPGYDLYAAYDEVDEKPNVTLLFLARNPTHAAEVASFHNLDPARVRIVDAVCEQTRDGPLTTWKRTDES